MPSRGASQYGYFEPPRGFYGKNRVHVEQATQIVWEYERYWPLTVRQVFYRMVAACDYPKTERAANDVPHEHSGGSAPDDRSRAAPGHASRGSAVGLLNARRLE